VKPTERIQSPDDAELVRRIRAVTDSRPAYGLRRVTALLRREGLRMNHKRVYRVMKAERLLLERHAGRPVRPHDGQVITLKSNARWCSDPFEIRCWSGERVQVILALDCCDREILSYLATTGGLSGEMAREVLTEAFEKGFPGVLTAPCPRAWLTDNGPAYIAGDTREYARQLGLRVCTTPYYSPEWDGMAEAFVKTFKRDDVYVKRLEAAASVMRQLSEWFEDYTESHPHKGLKLLSPREFQRQQLSD
jgi:transposase InsO family protein